MIYPSKVYAGIADILNKSGAEYRLFTHKAAFTYADLAEIQKETGFFGTEMKCMALEVDNRMIVYNTLQREKINISAVKNALNASKVVLASVEALEENFKIKPGCMYPFGFDAQYDIYMNPNVYNEEWVLFSPALPTRTIQMKGEDFQKVFAFLKNNIFEPNDFSFI